jgi:hypothetical protein
MLSIRWKDYNLLPKVLGHSALGISIEMKGGGLCEK